MNAEDQFLKFFTKYCQNQDENDNVRNK